MITILIATDSLIVGDETRSGDNISTKRRSRRGINSSYWFLFPASIIIPINTTITNAIDHIACIPAILLFSTTI